MSSSLLRFPIVARLFSITCDPARFPGVGRENLRVGYGTWTGVWVRGPTICAPGVSNPSRSQKLLARGPRSTSGRACVQTQVNLGGLLGDPKVAFGCSSCFHHLSASSEAPPPIAATSVVLSEYASQCAVCPFSLPALLHACSDSHRTVRAL